MGGNGVVTATAGAPCADCAGGGEINGLPCRSCKDQRRAPLGRPRRVLHGLGLAAAGAAGTVVRWSRSVPGVAGAAGVTIGAAMITHAIWSQIPLLAAALVVGGVFGLLMDRQI
jgi:hypothetical protein